MNNITKVLIKSFITNVLLSVVKIISGIIGTSGALVADGIHSLSDTTTDIFAIVGHKLSTKPADEKHPFGHGKIEYLTCIFIGIIIMTIGISIIIEAITSEKIVPSLYIATISIITILAKLILSKYLLKKGKEYQNNILTASGSESLSDVMSSIVVLVSIIVSQLNGIFLYADTIAMIIVGIFILKIAYNTFKENISSLLGEKVINQEYIKNIEKIIKKEKQILQIDSLIIIKYGDVYQVNCEVGMDENIVLKEAHNTLENIEKNLKKFDDKLKHITIHINPYEKY